MKKFLLLVMPLALGLIAGQAQSVQADTNVPQSYADGTDAAKSLFSVF